jgi:anthranilate phosphoribosyltransferase
MASNSTEETTSIRTIIKNLVLNPESFGPEDAANAMRAIMGGHATTSQISAFLIGLKLQGKDLDAEIVAACAETMRAFALPIHYSEHAHLESCVVDIVGTGGDGHNTYNVSTTASLVAAGAGAKVAKVCFMFTGWFKRCCIAYSKTSIPISMVIEPLLPNLAQQI